MHPSLRGGVYSELYLSGAVPAVLRPMSPDENVRPTDRQCPIITDKFLDILESLQHLCEKNFDGCMNFGIIAATGRKYRKLCTAVRRER